jgi:hypothetical protein
VVSTDVLATTVMMVYSGDGTARAGGVKGQLGHSARWRKAPNRAGERVNGEAMERAAADGDCVVSRSRAGERELTGMARLSERGRSRGSEGGRGDGWGRSVSGEGRSATRERARGGWAAWAARERGARHAGRRGGLDPAQLRGKNLFFSFFSISISLTSFFF